MRNFLLVLMAFVFSALTFLSCTSGNGDASGESADTTRRPTVIYLTRHAEKTGGEDPELLPAGTARADRLATMIGPDVRAVYHTNYRRTKATALPTAQRARVKARTYNAGDSAKTLTDGWLKQHRGKAILVVGHSNTVPDLVNALIGENRYSEIDHDEFGRLFKVTVPGKGTATVEEMRTD